MSEKTIGFIIAAGKQTRFESAIPKPLMEYKNTGVTLLDLNITNMKTVCDEIIVVCSQENHQYFEKYNPMIITSGQGCGDAVWKAISRFSPDPTDMCFIQWGDCVHEQQIYSRIKNAYDGVWIIPCVTEDKPYVQIKPDRDNVLVSFSKYGEYTGRGFHDLSVFYGNMQVMLDSLTVFRSTIWDKNLLKYSHRHNNEMLFLDVFNETDIPAQILEIESYKPFTFNTLEEFNKLNTIS